MVRLVSVLSLLGVLGTQAACSRGAALDGVWASDPTNVWIVGERALLLHWNGSRWSQEDPALPGSTRLNLDGVWGRDTQHLFFWGAQVVMEGSNGAWSPQAQPDGVIGQVNGLWGSGPNLVWAVSSSGQILEREAQNGFRLIPTRNAKPLYGVWGSGADAWAVGGDSSAAALLHRDGAGWHVDPSAGSRALYAVWGSQPSDVWAVGDESLILHFDGTSWRPSAAPGKYYLRAIWGSSARDIWAVGAQGGSRGAILHFDGTAWADVSPERGEELRAVWGTSGQDVWTVGRNATVLHWDGMEWTRVDTAGLAAVPAGTGFPIAG